MKNIFNWLLVSNRWKYLVGCFVVSLFGCLLATLIHLVIWLAVR